MLDEELHVFPQTPEFLRPILLEMRQVLLQGGVVAQGQEIPGGQAGLVLFKVEPGGQLLAGRPKRIWIGF
jgi:hypothetical protein